MKNLHRFYLLFLVFILFACGVPSQSNLGKTKGMRTKKEKSGSWWPTMNM